MDYSDYLKSPHWQRKRLEVMQRDNFSCRFCGDGSSTLHVHHLIYLSNKLPWEYDHEYLITLCEKCHADEEKLKSDDKFLVGNLLLAGISRRDLYSLSSELRRHFAEVDTRNGRFQNLMNYLYE